MLLKELFENHKIPTEEIPNDILNIDLGEIYFKQYNKKDVKDKVIIFTGTNGDNYTHNNISVDLTGINIDTLNAINSVINDGATSSDELMQKYVEWLRKTVVTHSKTNDQYTYKVAYNVFGGELYRV